MNKTIFLIENQLTQFNKISFNLSKNYNILPDEEDFINTMNLVRVSLNRGYGNLNNPKHRSSQAYQKLCEVIITTQPDLILLDHILIDSKNALNGIDLARHFRDSKINIPILFFSNSPSNIPEITTIKSTIRNSDWLTKTLHGRDSLPREILEGILQDKLETLYRSAREYSVDELYDQFLKDVENINWSEKKENILQQLSSLVENDRTNDNLSKFLSAWRLDVRKDLSALSKLFSKFS